MKEDKLTEFEIRTAAENKATMRVKEFGGPTPFTCPDCHGVLFQLMDGNRPRYRCHTGHAFSSDSLLASVTESIEVSLWSAIRCIEESVMLLNHMGKHFVNNGQANLGAIYFKKAFEAEQRGDIVRSTVMTHERLSNDNLLEQAGEIGGSESETQLPVIADQEISKLR